MKERYKIKNKNENDESEWLEISEKDSNNGKQY